MITKILIDASNIGSGGGITHLREFLKNANPLQYNFEEVEIWAPERLLNELPEKPWLNKKTHKFLNSSLFEKLLFQAFVLPKILKNRSYLLYLPGGNHVAYHPKVSFCQNLQPFHLPTQKEYGISLTRLRLIILRFTQRACYRSCDGMVYLTKHSMMETFKYTGDLSYKSVIIPHAVDHSLFFKGSFEQKENPKPFKILYVSTIIFYKRQDILISAVGELVKNGYDIELKLVGKIHGPTFKRIQKIINQYGLKEHHVQFLEHLSFNNLPILYQQADLFVMASSTETFGIPLLEAMASGIPVLCAKNPSLMEIFGDTGMYYETFSYLDLAEKIVVLLKNKTLREILAQKAYERSKLFTWEKTAQQTLFFFRKVADKYTSNSKYKA
jgi:glycosyltransferase involved in cell wall biosynthesis